MHAQEYRLLHSSKSLSCFRELHDAGNIPEALELGTPRYKGQNEIKSIKNVKRCRDSRSVKSWETRKG